MSIAVLPLDAWAVYLVANGMHRWLPSPAKTTRRLRYAIIICARNEERVIKSLISSLQAQDYAHSLYEIFVVADNCTDDTAAIARAAGATVWERDDLTHIGKGFALQFATKNLQMYHRNFDAICVFDADNIASPTFLTEIDKAMVDGVDGVTGFRDSKNAHVNAISEAYTIYWYMLMRFYHNARMHLGLPCVIGGTGFAFRLSSIPEGIWNTKTVTEDIEFTFQRVLEGCNITCAHDAVFYDEQPTDPATAWVQMKRWVMGPKQISHLYSNRILEKFGEDRKRYTDLLWSSLVPFMVGGPIIASILFPISFAVNGVKGDGTIAFILFGICIILQIGFMIGTAYVSIRMTYLDAKNYRDGMLMYPCILFLSGFAAIIIGLVPNSRARWVKTEHHDLIANEELLERSTS